MSSFLTIVYLYDSSNLKIVVLGVKVASLLFIKFHNYL